MQSVKNVEEFLFEEAYSTLENRDNKILASVFGSNKRITKNKIDAFRWITNCKFSYSESIRLYIDVFLIVSQKKDKQSTLKKYQELADYLSDIEIAKTFALITYFVSNTNLDFTNAHDLENYEKTVEKYMELLPKTKLTDTSLDDDFKIEVSENERVLVEYLGTSKMVVIPDSITVIGDRAFHFCDHIKRIVVPNSVTKIGHEAFFDCASLEEIQIPETVKVIGEDVFSHCKSLVSLDIPDSVIECHIGFRDCQSLRKFKIPKCVKEIDEYAFYECRSLTEIEIPSTIEKIGNFAFGVCTSLKEIYIPDSVVSIGGCAFASSGIENVTIPNSVIEIGAEAFYNCKSLTEIKLPNSLSLIRRGTFGECSNLTTVILPVTIDTIQDYAFAKCTSLKEIYFPSKVVKIEDKAFDKHTKQIKEDHEKQITNKKTYQNFEPNEQFDSKRTRNLSILYTVIILFLSNLLLLVITWDGVVIGTSILSSLLIANFLYKMIRKTIEQSKNENSKSIKPEIVISKNKEFKNQNNSKELDRDKHNNEITGDKEIACINCDNLNPIDSKYCSYCGQSIQHKIVKKFCSSCGEKLIENAEFCHKCGIKTN